MSAASALRRDRKLFKLLIAPLRFFVVTGKPFLTSQQHILANIHMTQGPFALKALLRVNSILKD